jgi:hypothetical protein
MDELTAMVFRYLDAAKSNGYFKPGEALYNMPAHELAMDLIMYAQGCEDKTVEEIQPIVEIWLSTNSDYFNPPDH